ncbi:retrovirus-related pol polyprotein from transposon TNT 1-94 [Tanacetum coccineum]
MVEKSKLDEDKEGKVVDPSHYHEFADADHAGCQDTCRSTSGSMQFWGDRLISWSSKRQKSAAISSTEAEYIALSGCYSNPDIILKASIPSKGNLTLSTGIYLGIGLLYDHAKACDYFASQPVLPNFHKIMNTIKEQQKELDDALEPTIQVVLDALKLTPFYNAFEISADVPEIYMQEFWVTVTRHHSSLRFKLDGKSHTVNVDNFRDMLKIFPKLPGQKFEEPPLEEDILSSIRDLGHTGEIKFLSDVNVNHMHQPWRSFVAIINKCLSGKTTALENLRLSRAQILWGHVSQQAGDILPQHLTNQAMLESEAFKTYRAYATGEKAPKSKGDGVDIQSKVPDEQQQTLSGTNEGASNKPEVPDVPEYRQRVKKNQTFRKDKKDKKETKSVKNRQGNGKDKTRVKNEDNQKPDQQERKPK